MNNFFNVCFWWQQNVLAQLASKASSAISDANDPNKYQKNLIQLEIYYEEFNYESIGEDIGYPVSNAKNNEPTMYHNV